MGTEITINAENQDGYLQKSDATWATAHDAATADSIDTDDEKYYNSIEASLDTGIYRITRTILPFDVSTLSIPADNNIIKARLRVYCYAYFSATKIVMVEGEQQDTPAVGDFDAFEYTILGENRTTLHNSGYNTFEFNAAGLEFLNERIINDDVNTLKLFLIEYDHDFLDTAPTGINRFGTFYSDTTDSGRVPQLIIEYDLESPIDAYPVASTSQGHVTNANASWATCRGAATGTAVATNQNNIEAFAEEDTGTYTIRRGFFHFDLSAIENKISIDRVVIRFKVSGVKHDLTDLSGAHVQQGTQDHTIALTTTDFDSFSGSSFGEFDFAVGQGIYDVELNASGKSYVETQLGQATPADRVVKFCLRENDYDYDNVTPGAGVHGDGSVNSGGAGNQDWEKTELLIYYDPPTNQSDCEDMGWYWSSSQNQCYQFFPTNQGDCENADLYWYSGACYDQLPDNKFECQENNFFWHYSLCQATNKLGIVKALCIDTVYNKWAVAGHEVDEIVDVFVTPFGTSGEPRLRAYGITRYPAYSHSIGLNGKIAIIQFFEDIPEETDNIWVSIKGMKDTSLIENPIEIMKHFLINYVGMTISDYNVSAFAAAVTKATNRGYKGAGSIQPDNWKTPKQVIEDIGKSFDFRIFFDKDGLLSVEFIND